MSYVSGNGYPEIAQRNNNGDYVAPFLQLGDISNFDTQFVGTNYEVVDSINGVNHTVDVFNYKHSLKIKVTLRDINKDNLAIALLGSVINVDSVTVSSAENFVSGIVKNQVISVSKIGKVIDLIVKDASNTVLSLNTDYLHDGYGNIKILKIAGFTQPFKATYVSLSHTKIPINTIESKEYWIRFWQVNRLKTLGTGKFEKRCVEFYRVKFDITEALSMLQTNDIQTLVLNGTVLLDRTKPKSSLLSQYGNIYLLEPLDTEPPNIPLMSDSSSISSSSITWNWTGGDDDNLSGFDLEIDAVD